MSKDVKTLESLTDVYTFRNANPLAYDILLPTFEEIITTLRAGGDDYSTYKDFADAFTAGDKYPSNSTGLGKKVCSLGDLSAAADLKKFEFDLIQLRVKVNIIDNMARYIYRNQNNPNASPHKVFDMFVRYCEEEFNYDVLYLPECLR